MVELSINLTRILTTSVRKGESTTKVPFQLFLVGHTHIIIYIHIY